jgi:ATP synthase subunit C.
MSEYGVILAIVGMVLAAFLPGWGSAKGVGLAGKAAAGAVAEDGTLFAKVLLLQLLPGTQGIYGFLIAFVTMMQIGIVGGATIEVSMIKGLAYLLACLPIAIVGYLSALHQATTSVASINLVIKSPDQFGKSLIFPAMVETYAILALLISLLAVFGVTGMNI